LLLQTVGGVVWLVRDKNVGIFVSFALFALSMCPALFPFSLLLQQRSFAAIL
jgi:hypothetical protein